MQSTAKCITLRVTRFKDTRTIVSCLVQGQGRLSFIVPDGAGREAARRRAVMMMPGSVFEAVIDVRENRSLQTLRDISPLCPMLIDNPVKSTVILFVCDFLNAIVRDNQPDDALFAYVEQTIRDTVGAGGALANRAICFLLGLQSFMGIEPDVETYVPGSVFDMTDGIFRLSPSPFSRNLPPDQSALIPTLMRMNRRNMHLYRMTRAQRSEILALLIDYYSMHFGNLRNLPTLSVLPALFE